jgi:hypothetical protein
MALEELGPAAAEAVPALEAALKDPETAPYARDALRKVRAAQK